MPYVFGYGSLINRRSASDTLRRELSRDDHVDAVLMGWLRVWRVAAPVVLMGPPERPAEAVFLDLEPAPGAACVGALFRLTDQELGWFDRRERQYERVDVSGRVIPRIDEPVYTYVGRAEHTHPGPEAVVMARYERLIDAGLADRSEAYRALYTAGTRAHAWRRHAGAYRFAEADQHAHAGKR